MVRRVVIGVLAVAVLAFLLRGATRPDDPGFRSADRKALAGFQDVSFTITGPTGRVAEWCALLAATEEARAQGLMHQDDLRGYDGMIFRWTSPSTGRFYMFNTRIPLSIAWFDQQGSYVSEAEMPPCPSSDPDACPQFGATAPYLHAIEVRRGGLRALGIRPGSRLRFGGDGCG